MKTVAVIFGGESGEHEVSLVSARAILQALDPRRFRALPVLITKKGAWKIGERARPGALRIERSRLNGHKIDLAFPIVHGTFGEDGRLQGLLDMAGIPYVGSDVFASAACFDKVVTKKLLREAGIPVAPDIVLEAGMWRTQKKDFSKRVAQTFGYPVFVKPARMGSSVGVSKVKEVRAFERAVRLAFRFDNKILIEPAIPYARELECATLGNVCPYDVAGPGEVVPSGEFYDFHAKYVSGDSAITIPAAVSKTVASALRKAAAEACQAVGVQGLARADFLLNGRTGKWVLNEMNTLPGFTPTSMYPKLWEAEGWTFPQLVNELLRLALEKAAAEKKLVRHFVSGSDWYRS